MCEERHLSEDSSARTACVCECVIERSEVWASNKSQFAVLTDRQETLHIKRTGSHT